MLCGQIDTNADANIDGKGQHRGQQGRAVGLAGHALGCSQHSVQCGVFIPEVMFQSPRDMKQQGEQQDFLKPNVKISENIRNSPRFWHQRQVLPKGSPDWGIALGRGMGDPARQWHNN